MGLTLQSVSQFISGLQQGIVSALSGNPPNQQITKFSSGTISAAITKSVGTQLAFVQSQAPAILLITRASTCMLPDLITFVADYYLNPTWNGPTYCSGSAIFSRNQVSSLPQVLLTGVVIQNPTPSPSSAVQYQVIGDPTNTAYSGNAGGAGIPGYTLTPGLLQFAQNPLIQAVVAGTASAVIEDALTVIASPSVPFDNVTNPVDINNGTNGETAPQLLQRFSDYISGLSSGTLYRIAARISGVQAGLSYTINQYTNTDQTARDGFTTVVLDDGSGALTLGPPASPIITSVLAAVTNPTYGKSLGSQIAVIPPTNVAITVAVTGTTINTGAGFVPGDVRTAIQTAIVAYVNGNGVGGAPSGTGSGAPTLQLSYVGIANLVSSFIGSGVGQGLSSYSAITVNGGTVAIPLTAFQLARTSSGSVSVS